MTAQLADVLAWVLIHSLWQGICVAAATCLLMRIIPARSANFRYVMCVAGMLTIVLGMLVTGAILTLEPQGSTVTSAAVNLEQRLNSPVPLGAPVVALPTAHRVHANGVKQSENRVNQPLSSVAPHWSQRWASWMIAAWLVGVAVMLLRTAAAIIQVRSWRKSIVVVDPQQLAPLAAILQRMCEQLGFRWVVTLVVSERVRVPAIVGVFAPCILVPAAMLTGVSIDHWQVILAHELAHIRRYDALVNLVQMLIESVLFFNPSVWWLSRQIRVEREACCDALAAKVCGESLTVARTLVEFAAGLTATGRNDAASAALAGFADPAQRGELTDRVQRLVDPDVAAYPQVSWWGLLVVMGSLSLTGIALSWGTDVAVKTVAQLVSPRERVARLERLQNLTTGDVFPPEPPAASRQSAGDATQPVADPNSKIAVTVIVRTEDGLSVPRDLQVYSATATRYSLGSGPHGKNLQGATVFRETFEMKPCLVRFGAVAAGYAFVVSDALNLLPDERARTVELVLTRGTTVKLQFRDQQGQGIPGVEARVSTLLLLRDGSIGWNAREIKSNSAGIAELEHVGNATFEFQIRAPGFQRHQIKKLFQSPEEFVITLVKGISIPFHVVDVTTGAPISGAQFRVWRLTRNISSSSTTGQGFGDPRRRETDDPWMLYGRTNGQGEAVLDELQAGVRYTFGVLAEGYGMGVLQNVQAGQPVSTVKLGPPLKIVGRVEGAVNRLSERSLDGNSPPRRTLMYGQQVESVGGDAGYAQVDAEGRFEINDLIAEERVTFQLPDRRQEVVMTKTVTDLTLKIPAAIEPRPFPERAVIVKLTGTAADAPARGMLEIVGRHSDSSCPPLEPRLRTLRGNEISLHVPIGMTLSIEPRSLIGYRIDERREIAVIAGDGPQVIEIPAQTAGGIHATILRADGAPAVNGSVRIFAIQPPPGESDVSKINLNQSSSGSESLTSVPLGGRYRVLAYEMNPDHMAWTLSDEIDINDSTPIAELQLKLPRGRALPIKVLGPNGTPLRSSAVELKVKIDDGKGQALVSSIAKDTDADGIALFPDITFAASVAPFEVKLSAGIAPSDFRGWMGDIDPGQPSVIRLEQGLTSAGAVIEAISGKPIPFAEIRVVPVEIGQAKYQWNVQTKTDAQGRFQFRGLEPIKYYGYVDEAVPKGTIIIPQPGKGCRFEYPPRHQPLTLEGGVATPVRWEVLIYPGSRLRVVD